MNRDEKIVAIRQYSKDLTELADIYRKCAIDAERLPDNIIDAMYATAVDSNRIHNDIVNDFESVQDQYHVVLIGRDKKSRFSPTTFHSWEAAARFGESRVAQNKAIGFRIVTSHPKP